MVSHKDELDKLTQLAQLMSEIPGGGQWSEKAALLSGRPLSHEDGLSGWWTFDEWPFSGRGAFLGRSSAWWSPDRLLTSTRYHHLFGTESAVQWSPEQVGVDRFETVRFADHHIIWINEERAWDIGAMRSMET